MDEGMTRMKLRENDKGGGSGEPMSESDSDGKEERDVEILYFSKANSSRRLRTNETTFSSSIGRKVIL